MLNSNIIFADWFSFENQSVFSIQGGVLNDKK